MATRAKKKVSRPSAKKSPAKSTARAPARKSTAPRVPKSEAIAQLTADHARLKKMFKQYERLAKAEADDSEKQQLASMICAELTAHATAEEELFYPAARDAIGDPDLIDEAEVEHASAKDLIAQIESSSPSDDHYDAKVKVLGEYINHHVEEEEGEMFPKVRKARLDTIALGEQIAARKGEVMQGSAAAQG